MKIKVLTAFLLLQISSTIYPAKPDKWFTKAIHQADKQLSLATANFADSMKCPRTFEHGKIMLVNERDWTSGFFPGSLWYMYELTGNTKFKTEADKFSNFISKAQYRTNTHDLGFILNSSFGNGYRITQNKTYEQVLVTGATTLMKRYNSKIGLIKSWDQGAVGHWEFPVIIDNMLNLELLVTAGKLSGNRSMVNAAVSHAQKTCQNHFRTDNSCFHVVNYDSISGNVIERQTHQGYSHESSWARGQTWAIYGFTMMYRETGEKKFLERALKSLSFYMNNKNLPTDLIPYWDFDAPNIPNEPKDASAAAVVASALVDLATLTDNPEYGAKAEEILRTLSSNQYFAKIGSNGYFLLEHSTGNKPAGTEIDTPLSYADYYYLEAMKKFAVYKKWDLPVIH